MKRIISLLLAVMTAATVLSTTVISFSAADNLTVNGDVKAKKGDKVTYSIYIADVPEKVEDVQMEVYYDSSFLTVDEDSIKYIEGGSPVCNTEIPNKVLFNCANGIEGWDIKEKTLLLEVGFTVANPGETDLTYYIQCMDYLSNSQSVDSYVITCDYKVNGKVVKGNVAPIVNPNGSGGIFLNFQNGKGEKNGGDKIVGGQFGDKGDDSNNNNAGNVNNNNNNAANNANNNNGNNGNNGNNVGDTVVVDGNNSQTETQETTVIKTNSSGVAVTKPNGEQATWSESNEMWRNIGIIALALAIVGAIIIKVVIDKRKKNEKSE